MALKVNVDSEGSDFFDQNVKGLGHTSVNDVVAFDNVFVDPGSTRDVIVMMGYDAPWTLWFKRRNEVMFEVVSPAS